MTLARDAMISMLSLGVVACASVLHPPELPDDDGPTEAVKVTPKGALREVKRSGTSSLREAASRDGVSLAREPLRGGAFPDGVIALTWDDGPDVHTLELARYLHEQRVSGTFFAVAAWVEGLSEEPGYGKTKLATGYNYEPVLADLVALGHRVGNHSLNHVLLGHATADLAREQFPSLPLPEDRVKMFRAPGGWWTSESASAFDQPALAEFVGPVHWDIDAKDWESSLYCRSDAPEDECEPGPKPNESRVRPEVIARRYLAKIESSKHGIVLMHDRVGDVGSTYALELAKVLVPELSARGYVFAPPVLRFGPLTDRGLVAVKPAHEGDLNGDGRVDRCERTRSGISCALGSATGFKRATVWSNEPASDFALADINGDGRADLVIGSRAALAP